MGKEKVETQARKQSSRQAIVKAMNLSVRERLELAEWLAREALREGLPFPADVDGTFYVRNAVRQLGKAQDELRGSGRA